MTLWTIAHQAPLSMGSSRQECWSGLPFPSPGDHPDPEMEPVSLMSPALAGRFFTTRATWEALYCIRAVLWLITQSCPTLCDPMDHSLGFSRQEYGNGLPFPSPENLPDPGIKPESPALQAHSLPSEPPGAPCAIQKISISYLFYT